MPTYAYRCERDHEFEMFHSIKDDTAKTCPTCGAPARRVPAGGAGLLFKGSGFYQTDYRSRSYQERAKADKGSADSGGAGTPATPASPASPASPAKPAAPSAPRKPSTGGGGSPGARSGD